jgi:hypothetical protein
MSRRPLLNDWQLLSIFGATAIRGTRADTGERITRQLLWMSHGHFGTEPQPITGRWIGGQFLIGTPSPH